jgi:hypothetical protein
MATAQDVVNDALKHANYQDVVDDSEADEAEYALGVFNDMMLAEKADGTNLSWTALTLEGTVPLEDEYIWGLKMILAEALLELKNAPVSTFIRKEAQKGRDRLAQGYRIMPRMVFEKGLTRMPSQRRIQGAAGNFTSI